VSPDTSSVDDPPPFSPDAPTLRAKA